MYCCIAYCCFLQVSMLQSLIDVGSCHAAGAAGIHAAVPGLQFCAGSCIDMLVLCLVYLIPVLVSARIALRKRLGELEQQQRVGCHPSG